MSHHHQTRGKTRPSDDDPIDTPDTKRVKLSSDTLHNSPAISSATISSATTVSSSPPSDTPQPTTNDQQATAEATAAGETITADTSTGGQTSLPENAVVEHGAATDIDMPEEETDADTPGHNPIYHNLTFPAYVDDALTQHRLLQMLSFSDSAKNRFNVGVFPDNTKWATPPNGGHGPTSERMLAIGNAPAVCWIIGTVRFVQTKNGRLVIGIEPLSTHDADKAKAIQYGKARPARAPATKSQLVYASKFLNNNGSFDEAYDATDELLPWPDMQANKIAYRRIRATDIVLLECLIRRYPPSNAPSNNAWGVFSIAFDLARVARVVVGPGIADYLPD